MKRVEIDPKLLEETETIREKIRTPQPVILDQERPTGENHTMSSTSAVLIEKPASAELERIVATTFDKGETAEKMGNSVLPKVDDTKIVFPETDGLQEIVDPTQRKGGVNQHSLQGEIQALAPSNHQGSSVDGFSNLEQLLASDGVISSQTAPILMPTDLLFEYDSDVLKLAAAESLLKLGALIEKNNQATFRIEGHTDSFGGDEYNKGLSLRRAEAVKTWLQQKMRIDQTRISTSGLGKSHLLVPGTASVQEQQLNRRVEIVISSK